MAETFETGESFTTRLSGILSDYPPGVGILKELLQNADDAGAKLITYTIDTKSYPTKRLLDKSLAEHQGPALRVFNDAIFTEDDWTSLRNLGDSRKRVDKLATGKFGLGFNSVYGWTDTSSILSGKYLVVQSPHQTLATTRKRGLRFNFVDNSHTRDLADQLAAFSYIINTNPPKEFEGTIVRIPLRTSEQAEMSEISKVVVTTQDLQSVFEHFQADVAETMPFLKSIERVEFYIDMERLGFTQISNLDHIREMREAVKSAIMSSSVASHVTRIEIRQAYSYGGDHEDVRNSSHLYHIRQRLFDLEAESLPEKLKDWTTENKAIPLISLATRLDKPPISVPEWSGRVFITLPLPIHLENTLVNVHSMFAVGRDRRSLWTDNDAPDPQMQPEILWNNFLVRDLMASVWHDLLIDMTKYKSSVYEYFPLMHASVGLVFYSLIDRVLERIINGKAPIWHSSTGQYRHLENGFISPLNLNTQLLQCLKGIAMPIFEGIPEEIVKLVKDGQHPHTNLSPDIVRLWLRDNIQLYSIGDASTATHILEYASADEQMDQLHGLPIFVCKNQTIRSLLLKEGRDGLADFRANVYVGTLEESELFDKQGELFLDIDQYPAIVMERIRNHMPIMSARMNLEMFSLQSFDLYARNVLFCNEALAENDADTINTSQCGINFVWIQKLWHWLDTQQPSEVKAVVHSRWLIPLEGGDHLFRACISISETAKPIFSYKGNGKETIFEIYQACSDPFPLAERNFQFPTGGVLRSCGHIVDAADLEALLLWITPDRIHPIHPTLKDRLREHILLAIRLQGGTLQSKDQETLSRLPIFKELIPSNSDSGILYRIEYAGINLSRSFPLPKVPCVPIISGSRFFDASSKSDRELFEYLGYSMLSGEDLSTKFIVPNLQEQPDWLLCPLIEFIFDSVPNKTNFVGLLSHIPFVTVQDKAGRISKTKLTPSNVIDQSSDVANLYFEEEQIFGSGPYSPGGRYFDFLIPLGMKCKFDQYIVLDRVRNYSLRIADEELFYKCDRLLKYLNNVEYKFVFEFENEWLPMVRLPAVKAGQYVLLDPSGCRSKSFAPLVEGVLGIIQMEAEKFLAEKLGWGSVIEPGIIADRIYFIVSSLPLSEVPDALYPVFSYLSNIIDDDIMKYIKEITSKLDSKPWLPGSIEGIWTYDRIFFSGARAFEPYMSDLPVRWSKNFGKLLSLLKVFPEPTPYHLLDFISSLKSSKPLSDQQLGAIIIALERLDIPKETPYTRHYGILLQMDEYSKSSEVRFAHPKVPSTLAAFENIPQQEGDLAYVKHLSGRDFFEDFSLEESIVTRIANTIKESSLWASLNEFVANAEDCGSASQGKWILDSRDNKYPSQLIFCPELKEWQGPALYFYNDGVFTTSDFEGITKVGMGSHKSKDASQIGKYGLGALNMYQFTDVPSMISGDYFIIFDPRKQYLPFRGHDRRHAGMRILLSQMRRGRFRDHLVPFVEIEGYTLDTTLRSHDLTNLQDIDRFEGTIFRFPIRSKEQFDRSPFTGPWSPLSDYGKFKTYFNKQYVDQARRSLVMLQRLKEIHLQTKSFNHRTSQSVIKSRWTVRAQVESSTIYQEKSVGMDFKQVDAYVLKITAVENEKPPVTENWMVAKGFMGETIASSDELQQWALKGLLITKEPPHVGSLPDVAIAAPITNRKNSTFFYYSLPFEAQCGLPVNLHGRFAVSPDRRSLRTDNDGEWNIFLARCCLPKLYFIFLERLIPNLHNVDFNTFWPSSSNVIDNEISGLLREAFWELIISSPRKLVPHPTDIHIPISLAIFDIRDSTQLHHPNTDLIRSFVEKARPSYSIVEKSSVLHTMLTTGGGNASDSPGLVYLTPDFVHGLLQEDSIQKVLDLVLDSDLKDILSFVQKNQPWSIKRLEGCYAFRLSDGTVAKVVQTHTSRKSAYAKTLYLVDGVTYDLFRTLEPSLIRPIFAEITDQRQVLSTFNISPLDDNRIGLLVKSKTDEQCMFTFTRNDSLWMTAVYSYITTRKIWSDIYGNLPILPLSNIGDTFVSLEFWKDPVLLPPVNDDLRRITDQFPDIYIRSDLEFENTRQLKIAAAADRFLDYLWYHVGGHCVNLDQMFRRMNLISDSDGQTLRNWLFKPSRKLTQQQMTVLKHLPIWKVLSTTTLQTPLHHESSALSAKTPARKLTKFQTIQSNTFPRLSNSKAIITSEIAPSSSRSSIVSAVNAVLVPKELATHIRPDGPFVLPENEFWKSWLKALGAKEVEKDDYIVHHLLPIVKATPTGQQEFRTLMNILNFIISERYRTGIGGDELIREHILPIISAMPDQDPNRNIAFSKVFAFILGDERLSMSPLAKVPLIPNRKGRLCRATELFDPSERISVESFRGDDSKFPHGSFDIDLIRRLGIQTAVTKPVFIQCLEHFEKDYQAGTGQDLLRNRAQHIWGDFCNRMGKSIPNWTQDDLTALAKYHFIPVAQHKAVSPSFRDSIPLPSQGTTVLARLNELIDFRYMAVAWTQGFVPEQPPTLWITKLFKFSPTIEQVVQHLVQLATTVAARCLLSEDQFFSDLKATYDYLSYQGHVDNACALLKERYPNDSVWLNENASLERLSPSKRTRQNSIQSLLWLPAKRIVKDLPYDEPQCRIYPLKASIAPYETLIGGSGMNILRQVEVLASPAIANRGGHSDTVLRLFGEMRDKEDLCDMTIIVEGRQFYVHRTLMACFSPYFRTLIGPKAWKESSSGILDLTTKAESPLPFATAESVAFVVEWVYSGRLNVGDNIAAIDVDALSTRLDQYLDILQLTDFWDMPSLKREMESFILRNATHFIRIENVRGVGNSTKQCNANEVYSHCQRLEDANREVVEMINSTPEEIRNEPREQTIVKDIRGKDIPRKESRSIFKWRKRR